MHAALKPRRAGTQFGRLPMNTMPACRILRCALLAAAMTVAGCRTVWVHENWHEGRFEEDYNSCRTQEAEQRAAFLTQTREEICEETPDGRRVCRVVTTSGGVRNFTPWKRCMMARGWTTVVGSRSSPISRPKREPAAARRPGKTS